MKAGSYFVLLLLGGVCVMLCVVLIVIAGVNQKLQSGLQAQQQSLNNGILGPQGQQIANGVIQEMDSVAVRNARIRVLMERYGYRKPATKLPASEQVTPAKSPADNKDPKP